ncbi:hypothetical protein BH10ACT1_BH10ACT1_11660 [soil metagenome]
MRKTLALLAVAAITAVAAVGLAPTAGAQAATGTVTVIHGVPGVDVDVYVNGDLTLEDFKPETVTDPLELPAGDYTVDIRPAGADPATDPIITGTTTLPAGANATLIAHLAADGTPTLGVFVNDTAATPSGQGRLVVRHTAAAPAVDVLAGGEAVVSGLENPNEEVLTLPAATVSAAVAAAGTTEPVIGPVDVPVVAGQVTIVYAIGSLEDDTLGAVVQTITVGEQSAETPTTAAPGAAPTTAVPVPDGVPSGDSGLAADGGSSFPTALALGTAVLALAGLAISTRTLVGARRRS